MSVGSGARLPGRGRGRAALAAGLGLFALAWLFPGLDDMGVTWDEPEYYAAAGRIEEWTALLATRPRLALTPATVDAFWDPPGAHYFNPHPPAYKELMALTGTVVAPIAGPIAGWRTTPLLLFALLVAAVAWVTAGAAGLSAGAAAGVAVLVTPRLVGHAHVAATDMPLTAFWFVATCAFAAHARHGGAWRLGLAALATGLAMATKFTGWLLPVPLFAWLLLRVRSLRWRPIPLLVACSVVGLLVFLTLTPPAWHDPAGTLSRFLRESLGRQEAAPFTTYYLGRRWLYSAPWHYAPVMTLVTVPLGVLALALIGGVSAATGDPVAAPGDVRSRRALALLCVLQVLFFWTLLALPRSPTHDGVRLFLPLFPFVCVLAGLGFGRLAGALERRLRPVVSGVAVLLAGIVFFLPAWLDAQRISPYWLSGYNELIGGVRGAARDGMEVSYWYDALTPEALRRIEAELPPGAIVHTWPSRKYFRELQGLGLLRADIHVTDDRRSTPWLLLLARKSTLIPPYEAVYRAVPPVVAVRLDGVELAGLYHLEPGADGNVEGEDP